jgi:hypothetical protein
MAHLRVIVGVPSGPQWNASFGVSLCGLVAKFAITQVKGFASQELRVASIRSSLLPRNRLDLMKIAEREKADYLFMVDCDHIFPPDILHRLLAHDKPIVAVNCVTKQLPNQPTARRMEEGNMNGKPIYSDPDCHGIQKVWRVGTGLMLIRRSVILQIPHNAWEMSYDEDRDTYVGEDWNFCAACERLGIPIYIDHDVSREVGHEGMLNFTHDFVGEVKC